jgi:hypothetical protein
MPPINRRSAIDHWTRIVCALAATLAAVSCSLTPGWNVPIVVDAPNVSIRLYHPSSPSSTATAIDAAEASWSAIVRLVELPRIRSARPEISVYGDVASYEYVDRRLTAGRFRRNLAFAHRHTLTAHVALQPRLGSAQLDAHGIPPQTLRLIAHEAAHLSLYSHVPSAPWLPLWFDEGAATWAEGEALRAVGVYPADAADDPWVSTYRYICRALADDGRLPSVADVLADRTGELNGSESYAVRLLFFEMLRASPAFASIVAAIAERGADPEIGAELARIANAALADDGADADARFRAWIRELPVHWIESRRSLTYRPGSWVQQAFRPLDAVAHQRLAQPKLRIAGEVRVNGRGDAEAFIELVGSESRPETIRIVLRAGAPATLIHRSRAGSRTLAILDAETRSHGRWRRFAIAVDGAEITVDIDGAAPRAIPLPIHVDHAWGIGVSAGFIAIWRGLRAEEG